MQIQKLRNSFCLLLIVMLSACMSVSVKPDLKRLYSMSADSPEQPPVVFIHGAFGSRLRDTITKEEVWPGSLLNVLFGKQRRLAIEINQETLAPQPDILEPYALFDEFGGKDYYKPIIDTLTGPGDIFTPSWVHHQKISQDVCMCSSMIGGWISLPTPRGWRII